LMHVFADGYVSNVDGVFFNQFFTLLILTDVIILLISFRYTEEYSKLIRNTGFIIATILIRLSFSADGFLNIILILTGVGFALLILQIFNAMENPKLDSTA
jgi:Ca2+/Na+ antiporter